MTNMTKRLDALEAELDRQDGRYALKVFFLMEGETETEARQRVGAEGPAVFLTAEDQMVL